MEAGTQKVLMDEAAMARTLGRMAKELVERHEGGKGLAFVGIWTRGVPLAARLARLVGQETGETHDVGSIDITLYRDDAPIRLPEPEIGPTKLEFSVRERVVVLVDDVLYTGRTVRAALDEIMDFGRPRKVEFAVLVDRGGRELPIRADYVGFKIETGPSERVVVRLKEVDGMDEVLLVTGESQGTAGQ